MNSAITWILCPPNEAFRIMDRYFNAEVHEGQSCEFWWKGCPWRLFSTITPISMTHLLSTSFT